MGDKCNFLPQINLEDVTNYFKANKKNNSSNDIFFTVPKPFPRLKTTKDLLDCQFSKSFIKLLNSSRLATRVEKDEGVSVHLIDFNNNDFYTDRKILKKDNYNDYFISLFDFYASFQEACRDKDFRTKFLAKINKDESWFKRFAEIFLTFKKPTPTRTRDNKGFYKLNDPNSFDPLYLELDDQKRLRTAFSRDISRVTRQTYGSEKLPSEIREYVPGDEPKRINWKVTGKSPDKVYVSNQPYRESGTNSPLHVLVYLKDDKDSYCNPLKALELIAALQAHIRKTNREVYLSFGTPGYYVKLNRSLDPKIIYQSFKSQTQCDVASHLDEKGRPFTNMLFLTDDYNSLSAMSYLYSGIKKANFHGVYLRDPEYQVYPLLKKDFIENG
jgi:hypothetical protein